MRSSSWKKAISKNTHDMTSKAVGDEKAGHASPHMIAPWWVNRGRAAAHSQVVVGSFSKMWRSSCASRYYSTHMRMLYAKLGSNWQMVIYVKLARLRNLILKVSYQLRFQNFRDKVKNNFSRNKKIAHRLSLSLKLDSSILARGKIETRTNVDFWRCWVFRFKSK